ncbi:MAG: hypothetical protein HY856_13425 [Burkholderiales bacterium]|nr:hypothetical protein [Burkholderiales bacterium]
MSTKTWRVVRYARTGGFGIRRGDEHGMVGGGLFVAPTYDEAFAEAKARNARMMTPAAFEEHTAHVPMRPNTKDALRAILVDGSTWAAAAERFGITQSGILRAMRRVKELNVEAAA